MRKENFVTSHLENRKKSQSSSDSLRTATEKNSRKTKATSSHRIGVGIGSIHKARGSCCPEGFVVYYWCPRFFFNKQTTKKVEE